MTEEQKKIEWLNLANQLTEAARNIQEFFKPKEIVIDKLGKWRMRNMEIAHITDISFNDENYPSHSILGKGTIGEMTWTIDGRFDINDTVENRFDLIEFISPPEFTEEGIYEMANGKTVIVTRENAISYDFREVTDNLIQRLWDKYGKRSVGKIDEHNLVRYLGKNKFEIDKPGVYENGKGEKIILSEKDINCNPINGLKISDHTIRLYYRDGTCYSTNDNSPIVKFISPNWNFEKGEPV